jgi:hypothetical protein
MPPVEATEKSQSGQTKTALKILAVCIGFATLVLCGVLAFNYFSVNRALQGVLTADPRNQVLKARAHYANWIDRNILVFDLTGVDPNASRADVFRAFLQYADAMKAHHFSTVVLAARGRNKFILDGNYFQELGTEYSTQNAVYTMRTFPIHLMAIEGTKPFSEHEGGLLGVLQKDSSNSRNLVTNGM